MRHITHKYTDPGNACVAVSCRVLQCVAVCCSVLQCVAVRCSALQCVAVRCSVTNSQILAMYREHSARNRANFCSGNSKRDPLLYWKRPIYWISECFGNSCDSHMRLTCAVTATHTSLSLPHNATHCNTPNQTYEKNASLSLFSWYVRFIREFRICVTYEVQCWWCKKRVCFLALSPICWNQHGSSWYSPFLRRWDSIWSSACKPKSSMVIPGLFSNGSFDKGHGLWPSSPCAGIKMCVLDMCDSYIWFKCVIYMCDSDVWFKCVI